MLAQSPSSHSWFASFLIWLFCLNFWFFEPPERRCGVDLVVQLGEVRRWRISHMLDLFFSACFFAARTLTIIITTMPKKIFLQQKQQTTTNSNKTENTIK